MLDLHAELEGKGAVIVTRDKYSLSTVFPALTQKFSDR